MNLESLGFNVTVLTCDGASANRKFYKMHSPRDSQSVTYKTSNRYSDDGREIYFMADVPHLIKTVRNCWSNSFGHSCSRALWVLMIQE